MERSKLNTIVTYRVPQKRSKELSNYSGFISFLGNLQTNNAIVSGEKTISGTVSISAGALLVSQYQSEASKMPTQEQIASDIKNLERSINIELINEFIGEFALKYEIRDYKKIFEFLNNNSHLIPSVIKTVEKIEEYFCGNLNTLTLNFICDSDEEEDLGSIILEVSSNLDVRDAFNILTDFQNKWLIPTFESNIILFNVILK